MHIKFLRSTTLTSLTLAIYWGAAAPCAVMGSRSETAYNGPTTCKNAHFETLTINGPADLNETTFSQKLTVNGPLSAKDLKAEVIIAKGPVKLDASFAKNLEAFGPLVLKDTKLHTVVVHSTSIMLNNSLITGNLTIKTATSSLFEKQPTLYLKGKSSIAGTVTFDGEAGVIIIGKNATFEGKVINGKIRIKSKGTKLNEQA